MNCHACGHNNLDHDHPMEEIGFNLCKVCYLEDVGGPCFPWEFR